MSDRFWVITLFAVMSAGCFNATVPPDAPIVCASNAECPDGFTCIGLLQRCVPVNRIDGEAPGLLEFNIEPARVRVGDTFRVSFSASEPLGRVPEVGVDVGSETRALLELTGSGGQRFEFAYEVTGAETQGTRNISANIVGEDGLEANGIFVGIVTFDFTPPVLQSVSVSPASTRADVPLVAVLTFDEPIAATTALLLTLKSDDRIGLPLVLDPHDEASGASVFRFVPTGAEPQGAYSLQIVADDIAGNRRTSAGPEVTLDFEAPRVVVDEPGRPEPSAAERPISLGITISEVPVAPPVVRAVAVADPLSVVDFAQVGAGAEAWTFAGTFPAGTPDGEFEVRVDALSDAAGNLGTEVVSHVLTLDSTPPGLREVALTSAFVRAQDILGVSFEVDEQLRTDPIVRVGGVSLTRDSAVAAPAYRYTLDVAASGLVGTHVVEVALEDRARNVSVARTAVVEVDSQGPELFDAFFSPTTARRGNLVLFTLVLSEPVQEGVDGPDVIFTWSADDPGFTYLASSGISHTFGITVDDATIDGTYVLTRLEVRDLAGNVSVLDLDAPGSTAPQFVVDTSPPVITNLELNERFRSDKAGFNNVAVSFDTGEDLAASGSLAVRLGTRSLDCSAFSNASPQYTCTTVIRPTDSEGFVVVSVEAADAARNINLQGRIVSIDRTPPTIVPGSAALALVPDITNPLTDVSAAKIGTRVRLSFAVDEPLGDTPVVETLSPSTRRFARISEAGVFFTFEHLISGIPCVDGIHLPVVTLTDRVGNAAAAQPLPAFVVDTVPPAPPDVDADDALTLVRRPWGIRSSAPGSAGPGVTQLLLTADGSAVDGPVTLRVLANAGPAVCDVCSSATVNRCGGAAVDELGRLSLEPTSGRRTANLVGGDRDRVFVVSVDAAGNASPSARVRHIEWVATMGQKSVSDLLTNPHVFQARAVAVEQRGYGLGVVDDPSAEVGNVELQDEGDGAVTSIASAATQVQVIGAERLPVPVPVVPLQVVRDAATGRNFAVTGAFAGSARTFAESKWRQEVAADPEGDGDPGMDAAALAYDGGRGVPVLVGASASGPAGDLVWEWTGVSWRSIKPVDPEGDGGPVFRQFPSLTYDPIRRRVLLFGGDEVFGLRLTQMNDLWAWDGRSWERLSEGGEGSQGLPEPRTSAKLSFDERRNVLLLTGGDCELSLGCTEESWSDVWAFADGRWQREAPGAAPLPSTMVWDPVSEVTRIFTASFATPALFHTRTWDGAVLSSPVAVSVNRPPPTPDNAIFDPVTSDVVFHTVDRSTFDHEVWRWRQATNRLQRVLPAGEAGQPGTDFPDFFNGGVAAAYDAARRETLVFGGDFELWAWNGEAWRRAADFGSLTPNGTFGAAMTYDSTRQLVWIVVDGKLMTWNGTARADVNPKGSVLTPTDGLAPGRLVYDPLRDRLVLFQDASFSGTGDVYEFNPGTERWLVVPQQNPAAGPGSLLFSAVFHAGLARPVIFSGGVSAFLSTGEPTFGSLVTASWDAATRSWTRIPAVGPEPRGDFILFYDEARRSVFLYGGTSFIRPLDDLYELVLGPDPVWRRVPIGRPNATLPSLSRPQGAFDQARGVFVLAGGEGERFQTSETRLDAAHPAHVVSVDLRPARLPSLSAIERVEVLWVAGAQGGAGAGAGVALAGFSNQRFIRVAANTATAVGPATVSFAATTPDAIVKFVTGDRMLFQVTSLATPSSGAPLNLTSDSVELSLRYRQ